MFTVSLFLGFPLPPSFVEASKLSPEKMELFISDRPDSYLKDLTIEGIRYFGKFAEDPAFISDLFLLEKNIYSILNKIVPDFPCEDTPLVLLAVPSNN